MREESRDCKFCGNTFQAKRSRQVHCSTECARHFHNRRDRQRNRKGEYWHAAPTLQCEGCERDFKPKRTDRTKFCSRACAFGHKTLNANGIVRSHKVSFPTCKHCGDLFCSRMGLQLYCSDACRDYQPVPKVTVRCRDCGSETTGTAAKKVCRDCIRKSSTPRKRARRFGVRYEPVDPIKVFTRDGWHCQMCGIRTPHRLRAKNRPNTPELDHIIPISRGGEHTYRNTQLLCRSCNISKSNKIVGQMRLFG